MALLVLLLVWGALIATWLRSRAQDGGFSDPVGTFNRHLRVLEKTSPPRYVAANQRRPVRNAAIAPYRPGPSVGLAPVVPVAMGQRVRPSSDAARRRAQSQKRRRDVFSGLMAGVIGSLVLGIIPGLHAMLYIQVLFDLMTAGYLALLVRMRNLAAERELKLAYMPGTHRMRAGGYVPSAENANRAVAGRDRYHDEYDYDYSDLAVRRAAN